MSARPLDSRHHAALAAVLKQRGLGLDGRPLAGEPGSLLNAPVTSARYDSDLGQVQRATRAQSASEARPASTRPSTPMRAEAAYGSHLLPKMLVPEDAARRLAAEREQALEVWPDGTAGFDFGVDGRRTAEQLRDQPAENIRGKERRVYERLVPDNAVYDGLGKLRAFPYTAAGAVAGSLNVLAGRLAGRDDARIKLGNNAFQFEGGLIGSKDKSAFTLGNSVLYGPGAHPDTPSGTRYDRKVTPVTLGDHEKGHTYQFADPLFPFRYVGGMISSAFTGDQNPYEVAADDFAEEAYRRRRM